MKPPFPPKPTAQRRISEPNKNNRAAGGSPVVFIISYKRLPPVPCIVAGFRPESAVIDMGLRPRPLLGVLFREKHPETPKNSNRIREKDCFKTR